MVLIIDLGAQFVRRRLVERMRTVDADRVRWTARIAPQDRGVRGGQGTKEDARAAGGLDRRGDAQRVRLDIGESDLMVHERHL